MAQQKQQLTYRFCLLFGTDFISMCCCLLAELQPTLFHTFFSGLLAKIKSNINLKLAGTIFDKLVELYVYTCLSQRSLRDAPIFRHFSKVAVNGTHQCDFPNFCGAFWAPTNDRWLWLLDLILPTNTINVQIMT